VSGFALVIVHAVLGVAAPLARVVIDYACTMASACELLCT
jgi:hypothetical protein